MSDWGMQLFDDNEKIFFDSDSVAGGVIAHVGVYEASATASLEFPIFAGRAVMIVPDWGWFYDASTSVSVDTALGYPRLIVTASTGTRRFFVVVY